MTLRKLCLFAGASLVIASPALAQEPEPETVTSVDAVSVNARRDFRPGALNEQEIVRTESVSEARIEQLNAQNVNQAIDKNPGIAVETECSICNVRTINLNNLPGRYTTLEIDGVPLFSSLSSAYGLDSVNVRGVQSIDIARGAGASLTAPGALAGVVNVVTKKPQDRELEASADGGNQGSQGLGLYVAGPLSPHWSASASASFNRQNSVDNDGNRVSEFTGFQRYLGGVAFFGDITETVRGRFRFDVVSEDRGGGALGDDYKAIKADVAGNPFDWSRGHSASPRPDGWFAPDGSGFIPFVDGGAGFSEIIQTRRGSVIGVMDGDLGQDDVWRAAFGYAHNTQHSFYEKSRYNADGDQLYAEFSFKHAWEKSFGTAGVSYQAETLDSRGTTAAGVPNNGLDDYAYRTPGLFAELYRPFFDDRLEANASLRYDRNNIFGAIVTPRLNLLFHHTGQLSSRLSLGQGYRAPTSFFEQDHGILDTSRIVRQIRNPEQSDNLSYALNYSDDRWAATISYTYNRIRHFAILDPSGTDPGTGDPITLFTEAARPVVVQGVDGTVSYQAAPSLLLSLGGEAFTYRFDPGTLLFSRPAWQLYASADFDRGPWDILLRATVTGPQDLDRFYPGSFDLNGDPKLAESPAFTVVDLKASYAVTDTITAYAGADNLFDYRQADRDSPLLLDAAGAIDVVHIWGPLQGRYLYAGLRLSY